MLRREGADAAGKGRPPGEPLEDRVLPVHAVHFGRGCAEQALDTARVTLTR
ncbi:hypothetical protein ACIPC1_33370 [Streptomyces sp. NPDC087263]|uniref:hypothetical protein n=1 Tax=Streptomyces sp. NPDC087263 TaxID=3365773 RepID=UPI00381AF1A5